jgi:hypothetical protein
MNRSLKNRPLLSGRQPEWGPELVSLSLCLSDLCDLSALCGMTLPFDSF